jgi:hypothetical protein
MNTLARTRLEIFLFLSAFFLGLALRLYHLGAAPLSDEEARWALQAFYVANPALAPDSFTIGPQPAYVFLTGMLFTLLGSSNFLARLWPAICGAMLPLLSWLLLRASKSAGRPFGHPASLVAVVMAFGLALDPGLVTVSRLAGGPMMALGFSLSALVLWKGQRPILAGIAAGLALLSGPAIFIGGIPLALAGLAGRMLNRPAQLQPAPGTQPAEQSINPEEGAAPNQPDAPGFLPINWQVALAAAALTILLVGTYFFRYPQGLSAWFSSLAAYLAGWTSPSGVPALRLPAALLVFQPLALIFAGITLARWIILRAPSESNSNQNWLRPAVLGAFALWLTFSLVQCLLYPARQVYDLVWVLAPLWALASVELANYIPRSKPGVVPLLLAGMLFILAALFWNTLIASSRLQAVEQISVGLGSPTLLRMALLSGILILGALLVALVGLGWSWRSSQLGLVWGLCAALLVYSISILWGASQLRANNPSELWAIAPSTEQAGLMLSTLSDLSARNTGFSQFGEIISIIDIPSMRWVLRNLPNARFATNIPPDQMPQMVISAADIQSPELAASYRGQDFAWWATAGWEGILPPNLIEWLTFRSAPINYGKIILWVRSDLFPGAASLEP